MFYENISGLCMMKKFTILLAVVLMSFSANAYGQDKTNKIRLLELSEEFRIKAETEQQHAIQKAREAGLPIRFETDDSTLVELQYWPDGQMPVYYATENANAAKTISVNKVHSGGGEGYTLSGNGVLLGEWDGGSARVTHQEFNTAGQSRVLIKDNGSEHYHACHVAGTMIASGVSSSAKGMSPSANLYSWDWNSDDSEMATAAANDNLRVSNHSYGYVTGWAYGDFGDFGQNNWYWFGETLYSTTEDYNFGRYSSHSQSWDNIAYNAPYYLICKAAGNDRRQGPTSGTSHYYYSNGQWVNSNASRDKDGGSAGYDCIGVHGCSKNILTVGAVNDIPSGWSQPSDVSMSSFSSWGPTDDGRIKPDIVANGVSLYSIYSGSDNAYGSMSGTSMATPNASGAIGLIIEHRRNLVGTGNDYLSSTIKGLICHTAYEAGSNDGPDYKFGWGLMNTLGCIDLMSDNDDLGYDFYIQELSLANGETKTIEALSEGTEAIKVTICWTDPKGTPVTSNQLNNRTPMLVNDLDISISDGTTTYEAWKLDPANPSNAATTGDNDVDNVEQVYIKKPNKGAYTITINHEGTLANAQDYSIIITGLTDDKTLPKHLSEDVSIYPEMRWNPISGAVGYQIQLSTDNQFTGIVFDKHSSKKMLYVNKSALASNTKHYWRVRGEKADGTYTSWTSTKEFTTTNNCTNNTSVALTMRLQDKWNGQVHKETPALVQLRSSGDIATSTLIAEKAGLIDSNGSLKVDFDGEFTGTYNLIVYVNGYMPQAISSAQQFTAGQQFTWDFSTIPTNTYMNANVLINDNGTYLLKLGDFNGDFRVDNDDNDILKKFGGKDYRSIFE